MKMFLVIFAEDSDESVHFGFCIEFWSGLSDTLRIMGGQKITRRQKDISRLLREKKKIQPMKNKKIKNLPVKKQER